jgi:hypothetical protein
VTVSALCKLLVVRLRRGRQVRTKQPQDKATHVTAYRRRTKQHTKGHTKGHGYICNATHAWHHGQRRIYICPGTSCTIASSRPPVFFCYQLLSRLCKHQSTFHQRSTNSISLISCLPFRETPPPQRKFITRGQYCPMHSLTYLWTHAHEKSKIRFLYCPFSRGCDAQFASDSAEPIPP